MQNIEVVTFDLAVFDVEAIKRAAYRFLDRFATDIRIEGSHAICTLSYTKTVSSVGAGQILDDFRKEVLDQDLRQSISRETSAIRNVILALAFSRTQLQGSE